MELLDDKSKLQRRQRRIRLWIGGSSGLARTYFNAYSCGGSSSIINQQQNANANDDDEHWILLGHEKVAPSWLNTSSMASSHGRNNINHGKTTTWTYVYHDLTEDQSAVAGQEASVHKALLQECQDDDNSFFSDIIIGIRPPLVTSRTMEHAWMFNKKLLIGLERLLTCLLLRCNNNNTLTSDRRRRRPLIIHISSVAAVHHVIPHKMRSETEFPDPDSRELENPYDRFKRASEELVERIVQKCNNKKISGCDLWTYTNLRLGAIFSDDPNCIQCNALALQARIGSYLTVPIDCNSSRNVACLLHMILTKSRQKESSCFLRPCYYYTRPTLYKQQAVPYGQFLVDYRRAHDIRLAIWIPVILVQFFVNVFHVFTTYTGPWLPYVESIDYLLQVTRHEHSFDLTAVSTDFPQLAQHEETIYECFRRRRQVLKTLDK